jgi:hypothetical protein
MYGHAPSALMVGHILFIFSIQEFIQHRLVSGEYKRSSYKNRGLQMGLKTELTIFSKMALIILMTF